MVSAYRTIILDALSKGPRTITEIASGIPLPRGQEIRTFRMNLRLYAYRLEGEDAIERVPVDSAGHVVWRLKEGSA